MALNIRQVPLSNCPQSFYDDELCLEFMKSLAKFRQDGAYTDITLKVGDTEIPCHKAVLAAASGFFHAMFKSGLKESQSDMIEIQSTDATTLKLIIDYIYTAKIDITTDNVQNLVQVCDQFNFEGLKVACEKFLVYQIHASNCIGLYKFAKLYSLAILARGAREMMLKGFKDVVDGSEFRELAEAEILEYITDDGLDVPTEDAVFHSVMQWTNVNLEERSVSFDRILKHVRLPYCTGAYLCHVVSKEQLMSSDSCQELLSEAREFHMLPDTRHELESNRILPRRSFNDCRHLVIVGGLTRHDKENRYCWYLNDDTSIWEHLAQLPRPNWKFYSVCALQQGILLCGGYHANVKKDCWLFDTIEKKWRPMPPMLDGRCKHRSVIHSDIVYVIGGEDDMDKPLHSVEGFDIKSKKWQGIQPMKKALSDPLVTTYGHQVFVFGGIERDDTTSLSSQLYDTVWGEWKSCSDMPESCRLGSVATVNDRIYIVGGYTKSCMSYNPRADHWTLLTRPLEKHGNAPAVVWRGQILVGGGDVDTSETTRVVEAYQPADDTWSYWMPLKEELSCHFMLNVDLYGLKG